MLKPTAAHIECFPRPYQCMAGPAGLSVKDRISQYLSSVLWYYHVQYKVYRVPRRPGFGQHPPAADCLPPEVCRVQGII